MVEYGQAHDGSWQITRDGEVLAGDLGSRRAAQLAGMDAAGEGEKVCVWRERGRRYVEVKRGGGWVRLADSFKQIKKGDICRTYEPDGTRIHGCDVVATSDAVQVESGRWGFESVPAKPAPKPAPTKMAAEFPKRKRRASKGSRKPAKK